MKDKLQYKGEAKFIVHSFHNNIVAAKHTINFIESKLGSFVDEQIKSSKVIIDDREIGSISKKERTDILDYMFFDSETLKQYNYNLLCVHIYSTLENFLTEICILFTTKTQIDKRAKRNKQGIVYACINILKDYYNELSINELCDELEKWRLIRNSIVHDKNILSINRAKKVSSIVKVDWTLEPYEISFLIESKGIRSYLDLVKKLTVSICNNIFDNFDDSIKIL